jgi:hypothetical protein
LASLARGLAIRQLSAMIASRRVRARKFLTILLLAWLPFAASAQEDKKTDDDKPADPDTGESTVEEKTVGTFWALSNAEGEMRSRSQEISLICATLGGKFDQGLELDHHENVIRNYCCGRGGTFVRATDAGTIGRQ